MPSRRAVGRSRSLALNGLKLGHTIVWAFFAGCTIAIPVASARGRHRAAFSLAAVVAVEVVTIIANKGRCPLSPLAARFTDDRRPGFDICIPAWLAERNTLIFGMLYSSGLGFALWRWARTKPITS